MENLEIKIRLDSLPRMKAALGRIGARYCGVLRQKDTYFACPEGRLKLREFPGKPAELIFYRRAEKGARRLSSFHILKVDEPTVFAGFMRRVLPVRAVVEKKRLLYYFKSARIHLDAVKGLGSFLEIESEVRKGRAAARSLLDELMRELRIVPSDCIKKSYSDLPPASRGR